MHTCCILRCGFDANLKLAFWWLPGCKLFQLSTLSTPDVPMFLSFNLLSFPFMSNSNQYVLGLLLLSHYLGPALDQGGGGGLLFRGGHYMYTKIYTNIHLHYGHVYICRALGCEPPHRQPGPPPARSDTSPSAQSVQPSGGVTGRRGGRPARWRPRATAASRNPRKRATASRFQVSCEGTS